jgi:hypothetical protein
MYGDRVAEIMEITVIFMRDGGAVALIAHLKETFLPRTLELGN